MRHVEAPNEYIPSFGEVAVFLAGGITNCPDWQAEVAGGLGTTQLVLLNPRRKNFDVRDPSQTDIQIAWEHRHLLKANLVTFWFCKETLCPITLFELGSALMRPAPIMIGIDPGYERAQDVRVQTALVRPETPIVESLDALINKLFYSGKSRPDGLGPTR